MENICQVCRAYQWDFDTGQGTNPYHELVNEKMVYAWSTHAVKVTVREAFLCFACYGYFGGL